ncbi:hypothetical protein VTO73DRAFT_11745 [Trametes versicolor]
MKSHKPYSSEPTVTGHLNRRCRCRLGCRRAASTSPCPSITVSGELNKKTTGRYQFVKGTSARQPATSPMSPSGRSPARGTL